MIAMVKLLFRIFILLHFLSLLLNVLANVETSLGQTKTWLSDNSFQVESNLERYVVGWYWGATILSSVGFGDITPSSILLFIQTISNVSLFPLSRYSAVSVSDIL